MAYSGSCMDMCPENERRTRFGAYVSIFECDKNNQPDESSMVKAYRRSGADQEEPAPEDLRTHQALENTMNHLVSNVMDDPRSVAPKFSLNWYDFLWDRLRAIRKDITQQNICDQASAILVEKCARFHVHSCYAMNRIKDFDVDMNKRNLNDCLQMLRQMYTDLKTTRGIRCPGELEFQIYDLLLHLDEDHLSSNIIMKTSEYRTSSEMRAIIKVFTAYTSNNYHQFFKFLKQTDYMISCLLSLYANKMRLIGMRMIATACFSRQSTLYPIENIINLLGFDDAEDVEAFASLLGMTIQKTDKQCYVVLNKELVARLRRPDLTLPPFKSKQLVENKMQQRQVGQLVQNKMHYELVDPPTQIQITNIKAPVEEASEEIQMQFEEQVDVPMCQIKDTYEKPPIQSAPVAIKEPERVFKPESPANEKPRQKEFRSDQIKNEEDVLALVNVTSEETVESFENSPGARDIEDTRNYVASMMPAGRFRKCSLALKRPTLISRLKKVDDTPKRQRRSDEKRKITESIRSRIDNEEKVNKILAQLASMIAG